MQADSWNSLVLAWSWKGNLHSNYQEAMTISWCVDLSQISDCQRWSSTKFCLTRTSSATFHILSWLSQSRWNDILWKCDLRLSDFFGRDWLPLWRVKSWYNRWHYITSSSSSENQSIWLLCTSDLIYKSTYLWHRLLFLGWFSTILPLLAL